MKLSEDPVLKYLLNPKIVLIGFSVIGLITKLNIFQTEIGNSDLNYNDVLVIVLIFTYFIIILVLLIINSDKLKLMAKNKNI